MESSLTVSLCAPSSIFLAFMFSVFTPRGLHLVHLRLAPLISGRTSFSIPTLLAQAFGIYRAHYLNDHKIPKLTGQHYLDTEDSYMDRSVDMFIPSGSTMYRYGVNSLYPYIMQTGQMPTGSPLYFFNGDIDLCPLLIGDKLGRIL